MQESAHEKEKKKTVDACGVATMNPDPPPGQVQKGLNYHLRLGRVQMIQVHCMPSIEHG